MHFGRVAAALMVAGGAAILWSGEAQAVTHLVLSDHVPPGHVINLAMERFAATVKEKTHGEVIIDVHPAAQMYGMEQAVQALNLGTLDLAWGNLSALQTWAPATGFASMPFLFKDGDQAKRVFYGPLGKQVHDDVLALSNIDILAYGDAGFRVMVTKTPVKSVADMKGLKLRVPDIPAYVQMAQALGANPTPLATTEVYTALQTGVIDGMESPPDYFTSVKIWEVAKYAARTNHIFTAGAFMASRSAMEMLSPQDQKIVRDAAVEAVGNWMWSQVETTEGNAWAEMSSHMTVVDNPDIKSFQEATSGVVDQFVKSTGGPAADYVAAVRAAQ